MIFKFLLLWCFFSCAVGLWLYVFRKEEKVKIKTLLKGLAISSTIAGILIFLLMLVNNIGGV